MFRELLTCLGEVDEPRQVGKVEHRLEAVLAITVCAVLTHAESFEDIELYGHHKEKCLGQFLALANGSPSHDAFWRVFILVRVKPIRLSKTCTKTQQRA